MERICNQITNSDISEFGFPQIPDVEAVLRWKHREKEANVTFRCFLNAAAASAYASVSQGFTLLSAWKKVKLNIWVVIIIITITIAILITTAKSGTIVKGNRQQTQTRGAIINKCPSSASLVCHWVLSFCTWWSVHEMAKETIQSTVHHQHHHHNRVDE